MPDRGPDPLALRVKKPERIGICWADAETFWWDATNAPICPVCSEDDEGYAELHGFFLPEQRLQELDELEVP